MNALARFGRYIGRLSGARASAGVGLDRLVSPRAERGRLSRSAYKGAEHHRLVADWVTSLLHPDDELRWTLRKLRARSRDLTRNNAYGERFLDLLKTNVIGHQGIRLQAQVRNNNGDLNQRINDTIETGWREWAQSPTVSGRGTLSDFAGLALETMARDGEMFVRMWKGFDGNRFSFGLEPVDADQVDELMNRAPGTNQNEIRLGVEVNDYGRPVAYHIWNRPPSYTMSAIGRERERIDASEILHLGIGRRANQTRFAPWFTPVIMPLRMLDAYIENELVASRISAAKMGFFVRKEGGQGDFSGSEDGSEDITLEANPGTFDFAPEGYELSTFDPDHPSTAFGDFVKNALMTVAVGLGISYNALAGDLEKVSYSSMRSGILGDRDRWRMLQQYLIDALYRPVYAEWLNMALLSGAVRLDSRDFRKFLDVRMIPRGYAWVDPQKDTTAATTGIAWGLTSRTHELATQGLDTEQIADDLAEEKKLADAKGISIDGSTADAAAPEPEPEDDDDRPEREDEDDRAVTNGDGNGKTTAGLRRVIARGTR